MVLRLREAFSHLSPLLLVLARLHRASADDWQPFVEWYPQFGSQNLNSFYDECSPLFTVSHDKSAWCQNAAVCIYNNINNFQATALAGSQILLGLTPTLLGIIAPTVESLATLSNERPLLSVLIAASTATLHVTNPFAIINPLQPIADGIRSNNHLIRLAKPYSLRNGILVSAIEYLLAAAATANVVQQLYDITRKTIVSWSCPNWAWVLCWGLVPVSLHSVSIILTRYFVLRRTDNISQSRYKTRGPRDGHWSWAAWLWDRELKPCAQRVFPPCEVRLGVGQQILLWVVRTISFLQCLMGTAILGSLLFVGIQDAIVIFVRFGISGVMATAIVSFELSCLTHRIRIERSETSFVIREREDSRQRAKVVGGGGGGKMVIASTPFGMENP